MCREASRAANFRRAQTGEKPGAEAHQNLNLFKPLFKVCTPVEALAQQPWAPVGQNHAALRKLGDEEGSTPL
jgi:hypothetical protein